MSDINEL